MHIEEDAYAMSCAVVVVETQSPQRQSRDAVEARAQRSLRNHQSRESDVALVSANQRKRESEEIWPLLYLQDRSVAVFHPRRGDSEVQSSTETR